MSKTKAKWADILNMDFIEDRVASLLVIAGEALWTWCLVSMLLPDKFTYWQVLIGLFLLRVVKRNLILPTHKEATDDN